MFWIFHGFLWIRFQIFRPGDRSKKAPKFPAGPLLLPPMKIAHWPSALASLAYKEFRLFWTLQLISLIGIWMQITAQGWLVYEITASKFLLGVINGVAGLPLLLLSPFGGVIADRFDRKKLLILTQIVFAVGALLIGFLISTGRVAFWNLTVIAFIGGVVNALDSPARMAFFVELIDIRSLGNAIALNSLAFNFARIVGPASAGYLVGGLGIDFCFYLNALAFIPAIVGMAWLKAGNSTEPSKRESVAKALQEGAWYIFNQRDIFTSLILVTLISALVMPFAVLMPVFAKDILRVGAKGLGTLMAFSGLGAFAGALVLAQFGHRLEYRWLMHRLTLLVIGFQLLFAFSTWFLISCLALAGLGFGVVVLVASINTFIQQSVPNQLRGRVMSFYTLCFMGFMPVGAVQAGVISQGWGAPVSLAAGALALAVYLTGLALKKRRDSHRSPTIRNSTPKA